MLNLIYKIDEKNFIEFIYSYETIFMEIIPFTPLLMVYLKYCNVIKPLHIFHNTDINLRKFFLIIILTLLANLL